MVIKWDKNWLLTLNHSKQMAAEAAARDRKRRRAEWWREKWVSVAALIVSLISLIVSLAK